MYGNLLVPGLLLKGAVEHVFDNHVRGTVTEPAIGGIVYCDLAFGSSEHSGVYMGDGEIMQLSGDGKIERVSPEQFVSNKTALSIYVSCRDNEPIGSSEVYDRASLYRKSLIARDYNVLMDNCHQFAAACVTGDPENSNNFLWMLKHECEKELSVDSWRVWERPWQSSSYKTIDDDLSFDELKRLIDSKMKLFREFNDLSQAMAEDIMNHMDHCPFDGPFIEKRTADWERKNDLLEKRLDGVGAAVGDIESDLIKLEKRLDAMEKDGSGAS